MLCFLLKVLIRSGVQHIVCKRDWKSQNKLSNNILLTIKTTNIGLLQLKDVNGYNIIVRLKPFFFVLNECKKKQCIALKCNPACKITDEGC